MRSLLVALAFSQTAHAADLRYMDDAALHAVQFVDNGREGWAVGDEGVILHTIDGGQTWERQATGFRASLRSLVFLTPYVGWVAGREELPHGRGSAGVLLFTRDGGETWQRLLAGHLPGLNQVKFLDAKTGFVFGDGTEQFASGVFKTTDGGRNWEKVPGPRSASWVAGDFQDAATGILAGAWSQLATLRGGNLGSAKVDPLGGRCVNGLAILPQRAVAVGQGGLVLTSVSGGSAWGFADLKLPEDIVASLDFNAIHAVGAKAWVVGRPGSVVLHTTDSGASWRLLSTGQRLPLHGVFFFDDNKGWAVGDLGTILATSDGGRSWKLQKQGGQRAAACFVHAQPEDVPLDTLAILGAAEGYLLTGLRVVAADPASASSARATDPSRFAAAWRRAGGAAGDMLWQFPLPQHLAGASRNELLEYWSLSHGNETFRELLRQLVLTLRMWRPDVLVTNHPGAKSPGNILVGEALIEAAKQAADAKAFPEQIERLGLEAWSVKKLYYLWDKTDAQISQANNKIYPRLEASAGDFASAAVDLLQEAPRPVPSQRFYRLVHSTLEGADKQGDMMLGMAEAVGVTRRAIPKEDKADPDLLKALAERHNLLQLSQSLADPNQTLAHIAPTLAKLPDDIGARTAFAIANQYVRRGQWGLAREAFLLMVDRYPAHPLAADAYRWMIRYISSSEARHRQELGQFHMASAVRFNPHLQATTTGAIQQVKETQVVGSGQLDFLTNREETRQWFRGSMLFGQRLAGFGPLHASDPGIQFCLQASRRQLGEFEAAQEWYAKFRTYGPKGPWSDAAAAELWLASPSQTPPRRLALCRLTSQKPYLDGKFDDPCWQGLQPLTMEDAVGATAKQYPTQAWLAYDQEFLYVALRCRHPAGQRVPPVKNRTRDANLEPYDRVSILLDLDRDYATYFQLQVDERGCVREDCWGDLTWDPRWFVAVDSSEDAWQIEAAIPLNELTGDRIRPNMAWAINVVRTLPGRGVQAWSLPADVTPRPEGMSLMIFHQETGRKERGQP